MAGADHEPRKRSRLALASVFTLAIGVLWGLLVLVAVVAAAGPSQAVAESKWPGDQPVGLSVTATPTYPQPSPPPPTPSRPNLVGSIGWQASCSSAVITLRTALSGVPYYAGPSTMRLENSTGDYRDFEVPSLGYPNPLYYDYPCAVGPCIPEEWQASLPYTLTVDFYNEVAENNEWDNQTTLGGPVPTPLPCGFTPTPSLTPTPTVDPNEPEVLILQYVVTAHPQWTCSPIGGTPGHRTLGCAAAPGHSGSGAVDNYGDPSVAQATWQQKRSHAQNFYPTFYDTSWAGYPGYHGEGNIPPYNFFEQESYYWAGVRVLGGSRFDDTSYHYSPDVPYAVMQAAEALGYLPPASPTPTDTPGPSPTPCAALTVEASALCLWEYNVWYGGGVTNNCTQRVLGNYQYSLEIAPSSIGPWTPLASRQMQNVYFEPGENSYGTYWTSGFPSGYNWYRGHMVASLVDGSWEGEATTTPASICREATPGPTITPTLTPLPPCTITFSDVPPENTFYPFVRCLACRGIVSGYSDGTFRPNNIITRGQVAKVVSEAANFRDNVTGRWTYADVPYADTFWLWVERLAMHQVMGGYPCGGPGEPCDPQNRPYFRPYSNTTRAQLSKIVSNAAGFNEPPSGQAFADVPPEHSFYQWIQRLATRGIMGGYSCGGPNEPCDPQNRPYFRPYNDVTRGQAAKIVANTFYPDCDTPR